jgi:hypothetical protein
VRRAGAAARGRRAPPPRGPLAESIAVVQAYKYPNLANVTPQISGEDVMLFLFGL